MAVTVKNTLKGSPRYGQTYTVIPVAGGHKHVYQDGTRIKVAAGHNVDPAKAAASTPDPGGRFQGFSDKVAQVSGGPSTNPGATAADPSKFAPDGTYTGNVAGAIGKYQTGISTIDENQKNRRTALEEMKRRLTEQEGYAKVNTDDNYGAQGLAFSGHKDQALQQLATNYLRQRTDAEDNAAAQTRQDEIQRTGLGTQLWSTIGTEYAAAGDRKLANDQDAANNGTLAPSTNTGTSSYLDSLAKKKVAGSAPVLASHKAQKSTVVKKKKR